ALSVLRRGGQLIEAAVLERHVQRHRLRLRGDRPVPSRNLFLLGFPRVEAVALGFAHAVPLLAYEIDFDVDAGGCGAVERHGHDGGVDALPRFAEVWEAMQADVPRRRIDAERD